MDDYDKAKVPTDDELDAMRSVSTWKARAEKAEAEVERLKKEIAWADSDEAVPKCNHDALWSLHDGWRERAEKAEAEVEEVATKASHFQHDLFCEEQDRIRAEQRAEQAEAKLARWKPLIEAVEQADKDGLFEEYMKSHGENALPIINAALTLKEAAEKREEEKK